MDIDICRACRDCCGHIDVICLHKGDYRVRANKTCRSYSGQTLLRKQARLIEFSKTAMRAGIDGRKADVLMLMVEYYRRRLKWLYLEKGRFFFGNRIPNLGPN